MVDERGLVGAKANGEIGHTQVLGVLRQEAVRRLGLVGEGSVLLPGVVIEEKPDIVRSPANGP